MARTIVVCGYGPGISDGVAKRFGREGFSVALVGRTLERLSAGVAALDKAGITARAFRYDLGNPDGVRAMVKEVQAALGPISVLHWNAYARLAGDLTTAPPDESRGVFDVAIHGLLAGVQESLSDLKKEKGAVLVTGGGFALYDPKVDAMAAQWNAMGLAVAKAAQHKLVGVLHHRLAGEGVYVGEVTVLGLVKGTPFAGGDSGLDPADIAEAFFRLYERRSDVWVNFP
jgi:NADP-dependent 3-hydroxy acid dehydrogenase YdfG